MSWPDQVAPGQPRAIRHVDPQGTDAVSLLREAGLEARQLYPELIAPDAPPPANLPLGEGEVYLVAYEREQPVGCGALRRLDARTAEVRRMYVLGSHRRCGVAREVLVHLEQAAIRLGYTRLLLETGCRQQPAICLYEAAGYARIAPFGAYVNDPTSVCFEKRLA